MSSSFHEALLNPERRRSYIETVAGLDQAALTPDVLIIGVVCAVLEHRFAEADGMLRRLAALPAPDPAEAAEYGKLLMFCVDAVKTTLYADTAAAAMQCATLLKLIDAADPEYRTLLVSERAPGAAPAPLLAFDYAERPLAGAEADVFIRKYYSGPGSRLHDIGWRTVNGLRLGGWASRQIDLEHDLGFDRDALESFTARRPGAQRRFAFVDLFAFFTLDQRQERADFLRYLRGRYDAVVAMVFDAWAPDLEGHLADCLPDVDLIWAVHPNAAAFASPAIAARTTFIPVMLAIPPELPAEAAAWAVDERLSFAGSIELFNIHRMYWYLLSRQHGDFFHFAVSDLGDDRLSVEESQRRYLERLGRTRNCLNFSKRWNGYRALTGRAFEVTALGRLLVQEYSDDVNRYFRPGEHFAEFETVYDLIAVIDDIRSRPERYRRMAADGHRFFWERYSDAAITRHFSRLLG